MKIAYLTNCFGTQSHTFIRREIEALAELGLPVTLLGIRKELHGPGEKYTESLIEKTHYLYPLSFGEFVVINARYFLKSPVRYLKGAVQAIKGKESSVKRRFKMLFHYLAATKIARVVEEGSVTHIHAHFLNVSASIAMYAAHHADITYSITVHSAGTYNTPHILGIHQKLSQAQFLFMISRYNIDYFDKLEPCRDKSYLVRCGIDVDEFDFCKKERVGNPLKILAIGRCVEKKGFSYLVSAVALLSKDNIDFSLEIVGDGPLLEELQAQAKNLGVLHLISFAGQKGTEYVRSAIIDSDIVVVPSVTSKSGEMEGLPVVIMEAMALGTVVIASRHSGIPEIVIDRETGLLTNEKDCEGIAAAIKEVLEAEGYPFAHRARELVDDEFNIKKIAGQRLSLFKQHFESS